jgi:hypothetical protein
LRRAQIVERLRLETRRHDELGDGAGLVRRRVAVRTDPRRRIEDVFDVGVAHPGPAHERDRREERPVAVRADDVFRTEPVLHRHHGGPRELPFETLREGFEVAALAGDDEQVGAQLGGIAGR